MIKKILIICTISMLLGGCTQQTESTEINDDEVRSTEGVLMSSIEPPSFMQRFAVLYYDNQHKDVLWGDTDAQITSGFFWDDSSFPGFNYTILIQVDYFTGANSVELATSYGKYEYEFVSDSPAYVENNTLMRKDTGTNVNKLDPNSETLVIYNSVDRQVYEYKLTEGTQINIG